MSTQPEHAPNEADMQENSEAEEAVECVVPEAEQDDAPEIGDDWKEKAYRLAAEMENLKKRTAREVEDARKYGVTSLARELLTIQDNLGRALDAFETSEPAQVKEGVKLVSDQMLMAFAKMQIEPIHALGEKANPELHQVMMEVEDDTAEPGTIVQEMQTGYTISGRLLRPSLVGTAKKKA